jgi:D-serine deaminase-like pyridoxal phosphate-dependent protein
MTHPVETAFDRLDTPCLLLDRGRLAANLERMETRAAGLGVALRPHLKTAKSAEVAAAIPSARSHGITVSTVKEAEYFAGRGFADQLYAVATAPGRLGRLAALVRAGTRVRLAADNLAAVEAIAAAGRREGLVFEVLLEIDSGEHRCGLPAEAAELVELGARLAAGPGTRLGGVFTHAGHSYGCRSIGAIRAVAEAERAAVVHARDRLRAAGLPCGIVSVGSTPTATFAAGLEGVTEIRAGVYVFQDLFQVGLGVCRIEDIAATVLTTVIGHQRRHGRVLVDAGGLALSKDRSTAALGPDGDCGYGLVLAADGETLLPGLRVVDAYQEHGVLEGRDGIDFERLPIGTRLRILPNHACMTCSAFDRYHLVDGMQPGAVWPRIHEWV